MTAPLLSSLTHDAQTALRILQRGEQKMVGELKSPDHELALIRALRGEPISSIGHYQVYTDTSREGRTTVFVHDANTDVAHKYILARTDSHTFVVAAPMNWTFLHKHLVARVIAATGLSVHCPGGGFVSIGENGRLEVDGASTDYGAGDHATAKAALTAAVKNSTAT